MDTPKTALSVKVFFALVIVGLLAAGYGGIKTYLDKSGRADALAERGVETEAEVTFVNEVRGRRIETYHELNVTYDREDEIAPGFAEVTDCPGDRWDESLGIVHIVYLPDDPKVVSLAGCLDSFDVNILPGILGLVFGALGLFMAWRTRDVWTS